MKRSTKKIIGAAAITAGMLSLTNNVYASDLTNTLTLDDSGLNVMNFEKSHDAEKDINNVEVTVTVNQNLINHILSQKPGHSNTGGEASLGVFYIKVDPQIAGNVKKNSLWYSNAQDASTQIDKLNGLTDSEADSTTSAFWSVGLIVQYKDADGWKTVTETGRGDKSISANLAEKLNITESELAYGVNYRFTMVENQDFLIEWKSGETREYVNLSYKVKFPVNAKLENGSYAYYPSVEEALKSESKEITVNENITVNEDIILPEDVKLVIAEGAKLTIAEGKTLTFNSGNITGEIIGTVNEIKAPEEKDPATSETTTETDKKQEETKPENNEANPKTFDGIFGFIAIEFIAIAGAIATKLYLKKNKNN